MLNKLTNAEAIEIVTRHRDEIDFDRANDVVSKWLTKDALAMVINLGRERAEEIENEQNRD